MSKFTRFLSVLLLALILAPVTLADEDQPIQIKSAMVETENSRVVGKVTICNSEDERVRFTLDVKNLTIKTFYKRKLSVASNDCATLKLRFTRNFAQMSNIGDEVEFVAKHVRGLRSRDKYDFSDVYTTEVEKGKRDHAGCADQEIEDGVFDACDMDFLYHLPSGLRVKILDHNSDYVLLRLTHIEWGGVKEMRLYKGRTKKIRSNYDQLKRLELTNVYGENKKNLYLKIDSAS